MPSENISPAIPGSSLSHMQELIRRRYGAKDAARGLEGTYLWLIAECGELAAAIRHGQLCSMRQELADVLAWLLSLANVAGVNLEEAFVAKYGQACPGCGQDTCVCDRHSKP
ncbi:MAG: nucleotide pyrophosphohydrolase [Gemmataceae bacterium]